ncbi:TULIP family P47-like protein [Psychroflexus sp. MES1-P1E]|uniref:TULIP family P47-like protein n=1 Tax=Psychroflexus sp. MES1-P1E TaxID=2058320 RepID=UPI000C7B6ECB|nr:TULIP family P47-like protein [Psychroflexus sp. MES1-P1E]PKG42616.1 hypothetical protein CXF67_09330 [Psychroflexus sp. MES1-P1E]
MATVTTEGWDLLAVANQTLINTGLSAAYKANIFPHKVNYTALGITFVGTLGTPTANLNPANASGTNSLAAIVAPLSGTLTYQGVNYDVPVGSTLGITSNLKYDSITLSGGAPAMQLNLDIASSLAIYEVGLTITPTPFWAPILNGIIQGYLQTQYKGGSYYLGTVNMSGVPASLLPTGSVFFATQENTQTPADNLLALVSNTSTGTPGILDFTSNPGLIPSTENAALYISNRCLLVNLVMPPLVKQLKTVSTSFNISGNTTTPYTLALNTKIGISGEYDPKLTSMSVYVNNSQNIQGDYGATGYPISSFSSLMWVDLHGSFYLSPVLKSQVVSISARTPDGSGSIHLSTGGWLIVGALVIATFGTLGAAMGAVVAIVVPIIITQLNFSVSMSDLAKSLEDANLSFTWPAQKLCPIKSIALPGDLVLYLDPQVS